MYAPPHMRSNPLVPKLSAAREEPNPEIDSNPKHRMSSMTRSFTWGLPVMNAKNTEKAAKRESVLVPRERTECAAAYLGQSQLDHSQLGHAQFGLVGQSHLGLSHLTRTT